MKGFLIIGLALISVFAKGQANAVELPCAEYAVYQFNADLQDSVLTYQYTKLWDFDADGQKDSVAFIGNGGAHQYFHFEIRFSSIQAWTKYETFYIDLPYLSQNNNELIGDFYPQFVVRDFDGDAVPEIYLNLSNNFASIPKSLRRDGVKSKQILIGFKDGEIVIKDFKG